MTHKEFEERSGLPSKASRETLEEIGGRHFSTELFELNGLISRYEQMQFGNKNGDVYMWKKISSCKADEKKDFEIHLEVNDSGNTHFKTSYC